MSRISAGHGDRWVTDGTGGGLFVACDLIIYAGSSDYGIDRKLDTWLIFRVHYLNQGQEEKKSLNPAGNNWGEINKTNGYPVKRKVSTSKSCTYGAETS